MTVPKPITADQRDPQQDGDIAPVEDVCLVVRAAGERTEELCINLLQTQAPALAVKVVRERPFARALHRSIEHAVETRARWTLFVDADVLVGEHALAQIGAELRSAPADFYMMNFLVLDRGFCGPAYAGIHAFQTHLFSKALQFIDLAYKDQRPETRLCKEMAGLGHPTMLSKSLVALHDYEQYFGDLYRKMFVRAVKYRTQIEYMTETFREHYFEHDDFRAMMWGLIDGVFSVHTGTTYASLDTEVYREKSLQALRLAGLVEKNPIDDRAVPSVEDVITGFRAGDRYTANQHWIAPPRTESRYGRRGPRLAALMRRIGVRQGR
jgi:hypothetical protein